MPRSSADRIPPIHLTRPGLFVTGTDTGVGKTVIASAIARALRDQAMGPSGGPARVGVCKPFATGCRRDREGLVNEDAEALAHFADCRQSLDVVNPIRYAPPLAPAVAAEEAGKPIDWPALARAMQTLDDASDALVIEGVGGLMVPLDPADPKLTVLDLILALRLPVVIVCRATLGTLNHTTMTARLLKQAGARVAGLVINGYEPDIAGDADGRRPAGDDPSMATNRTWLRKMTGLHPLAVVPACEEKTVVAHEGRLPTPILDAVALTYWPDVIATPG